jgi:hypothetical protein
VQFSRFIPFFILFDGSQPEPRRLATALMSRVVVVNFNGRQKIVASNAPNMESSTTIAFTYVVYEWHICWCWFTRVADGPKCDGNFWIAIPENPAMLTPRIFCIAARWLGRNYLYDSTARCES